MALTDGDNDKTLSSVNDLIQRRVSVLSLNGILGVGADANSPFAKALPMSGILTVFDSRDPAKYGFVESLNRPSGETSPASTSRRRSWSPSGSVCSMTPFQRKDGGLPARPSSAVTPSPDPGGAKVRSPSTPGGAQRRHCRGDRRGIRVAQCEPRRRTHYQRQFVLQREPRICHAPGHRGAHTGPSANGANLRPRRRLLA